MAGHPGSTIESRIIPLIPARAADVPQFRRRSLANLSCMGHCAPAVMQTLLDASRVDAPWLVRSCGGLPGGIGNSGNECGGVTAPLMVLGLRHAHDPLDRGVPVIVYKGHDLLRRFTESCGTVWCRDIRGNARVPVRCIGVVRHAPEQYVHVEADQATDAVPEQARQTYSRLYAHFVAHGFHCAHAVLARLPSLGRPDDALLDAVSGFMGGTVFTGRTCGALTAGVIALGAALGAIERSRLRVLRMLGLMAIGADAFSDRYNEFNKTMNRGHRLARWFATEFGGTQCRAITQCDFSTAAGVSQYVQGGAIAQCRAIAERVATQVDAMIDHAAVDVRAASQAEADVVDVR